FGGYWPDRPFFTDEAVFVSRDDPATFQLARPLGPGARYSVRSNMPDLSPSDLRADHVQAGEGKFLQVPPVSARVQEVAAEVVQGKEVDYDKALAIEDYLRASFRYDLNIPPLRPGAETVDTLLFEDHAGFCQQFATAMAVLARLNGLPARVVTGYLPGEYSPVSGVYVVREKHAHSWVEIHFTGAGCVPFDPTPRADVATDPSVRGTWWTF